MKEALYFIGVIPNKEIQEEITGFKTYAAEHYNASHALNSPPHITLFPPFKANELIIKKLKKSLTHFSAKHRRFYISLNGFNHFDSRVIYIEPELTDELALIQQQITQILVSQYEIEDRSRHHFTPHISIAFRDLTKANFYKAWGYYVNQLYERYCQINAITLLKHEGHKWNIEMDFLLKK